MFILRTIETDTKGVRELNVNLGDFYSVIRRDSNLEDFESILKKYTTDGSTVSGIIASETDEPRLLYKYKQYFVMTESGKTFSHIKE
jgi:hypothetical protein